MLRHQLAAYSPIRASACVRSIAASLKLAPDARPQLLDLVRQEYSADAGLLCGSGTQALQLAIRAAVSVVGENVPVALPAFTCFDVASAAVGAGVKVMLYDVDPDTLGPDFASLERVVAAGARIIVAGPLYGVPIEWEILEGIAERFGAVVIEDAAQGHGASWRRRIVGSLAPISILSFGRGKGWTGGNGGALLFRREALTGATPAMTHTVPAAGAPTEVKTALALMAQWALGRPSLYGLPRSVPALGLGTTTYRPPVEPASMTRSAAAAALSNRIASGAEAMRRHENAQWLLEQLSSLGSARMVGVSADAIAGYLRLPVRIVGGLERLASSNRVRHLRQLGVELSYPSTLGELGPICERLIPGNARCLGAEVLRDELVSVPTHSGVTRAEREQIIQALRAVG